MIIVDDVHKRYHTDHGPGKWVLKGITLTIPPRVNVALIGRNGARSEEHTSELQSR